jgi:hypothetical protein
VLLPNMFRIIKLVEVVGEGALYMGGTCNTHLIMKNRRCGASENINSEIQLLQSFKRIFCYLMLLFKFHTLYSMPFLGKKSKLTSHMYDASYSHFTH